MRTYPVAPEPQKQAKTIQSSRKSVLGFTLIEIMIVVALIGLLALVAIPSFIRSRDRSQFQYCINNLRQINSAIDVWALEQKQNANAPVTWPDIAPYIKKEPTCPAGGTTFGDSYSIATVADRASCQKVVTHVIQ
jgi:prepilin-type N-terminal cleavage/methylation domain-containing protein